MKRYVIAIGGNALEEKKSSLPEIFRQIAGCIAHLIEKGDSIAIVFGNGPQVGKLVMQNHYASKEIEENTIDECVAISNCCRNAFGISGRCESVAIGWSRKCVKRYYFI